MHRVLIGACLVLATRTQLSGQTGVTLQAKPVRDSLLVSVLNSAELVNLDSIRPEGDVQLSIKLYRMGRSGSCVPHTHWVCSYRYVLAVSEFDELPSQAVYDLGELGEIRTIRWPSSTGLDQAVWEVYVLNYPADAAKQNPRLELRVKRYRLDITVPRIAVTAIN